MMLPRHWHIPQAKVHVWLHARDFFKEQEHPRGQKGTSKGGEFVKKGAEAGGEPVKTEEPQVPKPAPTAPVAKPTKAAAAGPQAYISPNASNLTLAGAQSELIQPRQHAWQQVSNAIDTRLKLSSKSRDAIGVWADGAENTLIVNYSKNADYGLVRAAAAMKASIADQKAALIFRPDKNGSQHMASFEAKGSLEEIHGQLLQNGLKFHTLEPTRDGARVHILVEDQNTADAVIRAAGRPEAVEIVSGNGEFIGTKLDTGTDDEQRADAKRNYQTIIDQVAARSEGQDIPDVWRDANNHWRAATGADQGVGLYGSQGHPGLISSRRPTAVGALESDRYRRVDLAAMRQEPENFAKNMGLLKNAAAYPNFRPGELEGKTSDEISRVAIDHAKANLKFLYDNVDKEVREQGPKWYEGANRMAADQAKKYDLPLQSTAAVFAALSPQKNWDENVYLAERVIDIVQTKQNQAWDDKMTAKGEEIWGAKHPDHPTPQETKNMAAALRNRSKKLSELTDLGDKAIWVRTYDEANSDRHFQRLSPDGTALGLQRNEDGTPARAAWQSNAAIANAIQALESGGDRNVISDAMGDRHKVRSFYNNILDPHSANGDVTMDTHAVGAALLRPLSGASQAVMHNLALTPQSATSHPEGWQAAAGSAKSGLKGIYGLWADAYREAAGELGIEPRVLQSVTWEAKRRMMPDTMPVASRNPMETAWRDYHAGKADIEATQNKVLEIARGKSTRRSDSALDARQRSGDLARELYQGQLGQHPTRAVDSRVRGTTARRAAGSQQDTGGLGADCVRLCRGVYLHLHRH